MMRRTRPLALFLALAFVPLALAGCMPGDTPTPGFVDPAGFATYVHPTGVFALSLPPDWVIGDRSDAFELDVAFSPPDAPDPLAQVTVISAQTLAQSRPETGDAAAGGIVNLDDLADLYLERVVEPSGGTYKEVDRELQGDGSLRIRYLIDSPGGTSQHNDFLQVTGPYFVAMRTRLTDDPARQRTLGLIVNTLRVDVNAGWASDPTGAAATGAQLVGFANLNHWADSSGGFVVVGQVINQADEPLEFIRINAGVYDAAGNLLAEQDDFVSSDMLLPGQLAPYSITFSDGLPPGAERYTLEASARYADVTTQTFYGPENFALSSEATFEANGVLVVRGQVRNEGNLNANLVKVIVTVFDEQRRVVATDTSLVEMPSLAVGDVSNFSVRFFELGGSPGSFVVTAQGTIAE
jgi:hypothetical protein